jgi:Zn-dependent peptidase ImmA (M78 family)
LEVGKERKYDTRGVGGGQAGWSFVFGLAASRERDAQRSSVHVFAQPPTMFHVTARNDAEEVLNSVWLPFHAAEPIPVDPIQIARRLGVVVYRTHELDQNVSGALVKEPNTDPTILINAMDSRNRQRFTCAHELGHYIHRSGTEEKEFSYIDLRDPVASKGLDPDEIYANQFAACLLMPESFLKARKGAGPVALAALFNVSLEAMNLRLKNLHLA